MAILVPWPSKETTLAHILGWVLRGAGLVWLAGLAGSVIVHLVDAIFLGNLQTSIQSIAQWTSKCGLLTGSICLTWLLWVHPIHEDRKALSLVPMVFGGVLATLACFCTLCFVDRSNFIDDSSEVEIFLFSLTHVLKGILFDVLEVFRIDLNARDIYLPDVQFSFWILVARTFSSLAFLKVALSFLGVRVNRQDWAR